MVRVPVTPAFWATWKRYCDTAVVSMGRAIAALIDQELATVLDDSKGAAPSVFEEQAQQRLADRSAALTKRESELGAAEERMRRWSEHLREQEREIEARERRVEAATRLSDEPAPLVPRSDATNAARVGRVSSTSSATAYRAGQSAAPDNVWLAPSAGSARNEVPDSLSR